MWREGGESVRNVAKDDFVPISRVKLFDRERMTRCERGVKERRNVERT